MKATLITLSKVLLLALCICVTAPAQDDTDTPTNTGSGESETNDSGDSSKSAKKKKATSKKKKSVMSSLSEMDVFNAEPDKKAKFFFYLQSGSYCPHCVKAMPNIVKIYPEMKKDKVEIILIGCDRNKEASQGFLQTFKAPFPGVMHKEGRELPGFVEVRGIPHAAFVNAKGQLIEAGGVGLVWQWKKLIKQKPKKESKNSKVEK